VASEQSVNAVLEVQLDDHGSIAGTLRGETGEPISFTGWLGLVAAITGLADRTRSPGQIPKRDPAALLAGEIDRPQPSRLWGR
jgi:hypothetical protein